MHLTDSPPTREDAATGVWRKNGRRESTIKVYLHWVHRFEWAPDIQGDLPARLTRADVKVFAATYALSQGIQIDEAVRCACVALKSWSCALRLAGFLVPDWEPTPPPPLLPPLVVEYVAFRRQHAGVAASTIRSDVRAISEFLGRLQDGGRSHGDIQIRDVDDFVTALAGRVSTRTVARACASLRSFLRFLHFRAYLVHDVAASVASPRFRLSDRPPRALSWEDVQRLLGSVDVGSRTGRRDYALMLLMATYGMGTAETLQLQLSDIDWRAGTIHMIRPKTGVESLLPLLAGVADAVVAYLRDGRPRCSTTRALFVRAVAPYGPMSASAVGHAIQQYGRRAGLTATTLGGHTLRHSHACRQVELGAPPKVVSDILGHRDPASTSSYFRVATERLRELALPVPI